MLYEVITLPSGVRPEIHFYFLLGGQASGFALKTEEGFSLQYRLV